jgi:hypothetical protein
VQLAVHVVLFNWYYSRDTVPLDVVLFTRYCSPPPPPVLCPVWSPCRTTSRLLSSVFGSRPSSKRPRTSRRRPPLPVVASRPPALEQTATAARQHVPSLSSSSSSPAVASQLIPTSSLTYEDTLVARLHLQTVAVLNARQLVNIILDSSTNYASWHDLME